MYKSPVELIAKPMYTEMINEQENYILQAIQEMGVNVDKEELLKALAYDREQYSKGYMDGAIAFAERLRSNIIATHKTVDGYCRYEMEDSDIDNLLKEMGVEGE